MGGKSRRTKICHRISLTFPCSDQLISFKIIFHVVLGATFLRLLCSLRPSSALLVSPTLAAAGLTTETASLNTVYFCKRIICLVLSIPAQTNHAELVSAPGCDSTELNRAGLKMPLNQTENGFVAIRIYLGMRATKSCVDPLYMLVITRLVVRSL